jgi:serine/threonine-protein kinase
MRPQVGEVINGKYRLVRLIGEGGMGSVFEARHEYLGSAVALKFLDPLLAQRPGLVARFIQEARVSASIRSPHVVHVSDVDQTAKGLPYLVMELLEGESLQALLTRSPRLGLPTALDIAIQILNGLEAAHERSIVHRDLKPDNVVIVNTQQGALVKLLDFGIAKLRTSHELMQGLTHPGMMMGTPEYMAPEQAFAADSVDARADIYALGVIVFEMLSGRRPVAGDDPRIIAAAVMAGDLPVLNDVDPAIPIGLSNAVRRALAGRPADRFSSAQEMRSALLPFCTVTAQAAGAGAYPDVIPATPSPPKPGTAKLDMPLMAPAADKPAPTAPGSDPPAAAAASPAKNMPPSPLGMSVPLENSGAMAGAPANYSPTANEAFAPTSERGFSPGETADDFSPPVPPGGGVSPTLPPSEAEPTGVGRTGTVLGDEGGPDMADPATSDYASTAHMEPIALAPTSFAQRSPQEASLAMPPPARRAKGRSSLSIIGIFAAVVGALAALAVIGFIVVSSQSDDDDDDGPATINTIDTSGPVATVTPTTTGAMTETTPTFTTPPPTLPTVTTQPTRTGGGTGPIIRRDAGVAEGGTADGGKADSGGLWGIPTTLPSSVLPPPLPLPSGLPTLPPFPGWGPPPK